MIEQREIVTSQEEAGLPESLQKMKQALDSFKGYLGSESLSGLVKRELGIATYAVHKILKTVRELGIVWDRDPFDDTTQFSKDEALEFAGICWTIDEGFRQTQTSPYEVKWSEIVDKTRDNLAANNFLANNLKPPNREDAVYSTGNTSYKDFSVGRKRSSKFGDLSDRLDGTERELSAAEVFMETQMWDREKLTGLYVSLHGSVDPVKADCLPPEYIAERIVRISGLAVKRPSYWKIDDIEEFFFKNDVKVCVQLMELLGVDDLIELESAVRRMAASGGKVEELKINSK